MKTKKYFQWKCETKRFLKKKKNEWKKIEMKKTIFSRAKEQNVFCFGKKTAKKKHLKTTLKWRQKIVSAKMRDKTFFKKQKKWMKKKIEMKKRTFSRAKEQNVLCFGEKLWKKTLGKNFEMKTKKYFHRKYEMKKTKWIKKNWNEKWYFQQIEGTKCILLWTGKAFGKKIGNEDKKIFSAKMRHKTFFEKQKKRMKKLRWKNKNFCRTKEQNVLFCWRRNCEKFIGKKLWNEDKKIFSAKIRDKTFF